MIDLFEAVNTQLPSHNWEMVEHEFELMEKLIRGNWTFDSIDGGSIVLTTEIKYETG